MVSLYPYRHIMKPLRIIVLKGFSCVSKKYRLSEWRSCAFGSVKDKGSKE